MGRDKNEFWHSTFAHVIQMIDMYADEMQMQNAAMHHTYYESKYFKSREEAVTISSMKEIKGW